MQSHESKATDQTALCSFPVPGTPGESKESTVLLSTSACNLKRGTGAFMSFIGSFDSKKVNDQVATLLRILARRTRTSQSDDLEGFQHTESPRKCEIIVSSGAKPLK